MPLELSPSGYGKSDRITDVTVYPMYLDHAWNMPSWTKDMVFEKWQFL